MAFKFINFRATSGFVTDSGSDTYSLGESAPQTRGGITNFDWDADLTAQTRDRNAGVTPRLAGIIYNSNGGAVRTLTIPLPAGAGTYSVSVALGDEAGIQGPHKVVLKDGATTVATISTGANSAGAMFYDASAVEYSTANWTGSQTPLTGLVFSSGTMTVEIGGAASGLTSLATIGWEQTAAGGGSSTVPPPLPRFNLAILNH